MTPFKPTGHPGVILSGGRSTRMGQSKALLPFGPAQLIDHVAARLAPQVTALAVNSNDPAITLADTAVVADQFKDFPGPLAGIHAALAHARIHWPEAGHVAIVPVDVPFFPTDLVGRLAAGLTAADDIVLAMSSGRLHPVIGLWPVSLLERLTDWLTDPPTLRVDAFLDGLPVRTVVFAPQPTPQGDLDPFFNINRPDDLDTARRTYDAMTMTGPRIFGIAGWKNSGKTGLAVRLVSELIARGYSVSTIKHAHHDFDIDKVGADSFRHREAGAHEVTIVSGTRYAIMHELRGAPEPSLAEVLARLAPCDIVLIEGYKREPVPKIEARRLEAKSREPLAPTDPHIVAIAADHAVADTHLPTFDLDRTAEIADFVLKTLGLPATRQD